MKKGVVIVIDNDKKFRETCIALLNEVGYETCEASKPEEAYRLLERVSIDVAVIDVRLKDDNSQDDYSGLELAKAEVFRDIPKIILTAYPVSNENANEVLGIPQNGLPSAMRILSKPEVMTNFAKTLPEAIKSISVPSEVRDAAQPLLNTISQVLDVWPRLRIATSIVTSKIDRYHAMVNKQAQMIYWIVIIVAFVGTLIVILGIALSLTGRLAIGVAAAIGGIVDTMAAVYYARLNEANRRVDTVYHQELLQIHKLELLLGYSYLLPGEDQAEMQQQILKQTATSWFSFEGNDTAIAK